MTSVCCSVRHTHVWFPVFISNKLREADYQEPMTDFAVCGRYCLLPLKLWVRGLNSYSRHGCVFQFVLCFVACGGALRSATRFTEFVSTRFINSKNGRRCAGCPVTPV